MSLGLISAAYVMRLLRATMLDVLRLDYVRTARAKGLPRGSVIGRHALRNALVPVVTVVALDLGVLIGNSVLTEIVFSRPGLGQAPDRRAQPARLPDAAGDDGDLHAGRRAGEPADRPRLRLRRSTGETEMSAPASTDAAAPSAFAHFASATLKAFNTNKTSWIGLVVFIIVILAAIFAPWLAPFDPNDQNIMEKLRAPTLEHWLGTDSFGRDTLSRLLYGARISLIIGIVSTFAAMVIGTAIGMLAGWHGGRLDTVTMQAMDVLLAFPSLILGLILVAMLGPSMVNIIIAIALTSIPPFARIARAPTIAVKEREFVDAGRALGYSDTRLLVGHILPNIFPEIGKAEIIVCANNFHGRTTTIVSFSSDEQYRDGFGPFTPGFKIIPYGDVDALQDAITANTCAFLVEPIQGEAGIIIPPKGFLKRAAEICQKNRVLFIADEIQSGLGRTGKLFAFEHEGVRPDAVIVGKALSGGFYPVSAMLASKEVLGVFHPGDHGSTFGGNPLGCAVARAALQVLVEEKLIERSAELGAYFLEKLRTVRSPHIKEVRGRGLWIGIELNQAARPFCEALKQAGVLCKETHDVVIRIAPPLVITKAEIDWALERIAKVLA